MADSPLSDADSLSSAGASTEPLPGSDPAPHSPVKRTSGPSRRNTGGRGGNESDSSLTEQDSSDNELDRDDDQDDDRLLSAKTVPNGHGNTTDLDDDDDDDDLDMEPTPRAKPNQKRRAIDDDEEDDNHVEPDSDHANRPGQPNSAVSNRFDAVMRAIDASAQATGEGHEEDAPDVSGDEQDQARDAESGQSFVKRLRRGGPSTSGSVVSSSTANGHMSRAGSPANSLSELEDETVALIANSAPAQHGTSNIQDGQLDNTDDGNLSDGAESDLPIVKKSGRGRGRGGAMKSRGARGGKRGSGARGGAVSQRPRSVSPSARSDSPLSVVSSADGAALLKTMKEEEALGPQILVDEHEHLDDEGHRSAEDVDSKEQGRNGADYATGRSARGRGRGRARYRAPRGRGRGALSAPSMSHSGSNDSSTGNFDLHDGPLVNAGYGEMPELPQPTGLVEFDTSEPARLDDQLQQLAQAGDQHFLGSVNGVKSLETESNLGVGSREEQDDSQSRDGGVESEEPFGAKEKPQQDKESKREPIKRVAPASAKKGGKKPGKKGKGKDKAVDLDALAAEDDDANESDHEEDSSDAAFMRKRAEAMEHLTKIEIHFAKLRDMLYVERLTEVEKDRIAIETGAHPELIHLTQLLELRRNKRLELAKAWLDGLESSYDRQYIADEHAMWNQWQNKRAELRTGMLDEANSKRRRIDREKRSLERPKDDTLATILAPRPPPAVPLHHRRRLGFEGEALVENEIAWALRNPDVRADSSLSGLEDADAYADLERMGLREAVSHPGLYGHYDAMYGPAPPHLSAFADPRTAHLAPGYPYSAYDPAAIAMQSHSYAAAAAAAAATPAGFSSLPPLPGRDQPPSRPPSNPKHGHYPSEIGGGVQQHAYTAASNRIYPYSTYPDTITAEAMHAQHGSWPGKASHSFNLEDERRRTLSAGGTLGVTESLDSIAGSRQSGGGVNGHDERSSESGGRTTPVGGANPKARLTLDDHMSHRSPKSTTTATKAAERAGSGRSSPASFMAIPTIPPFDRHRHEMAVAAARANSPRPAPATKPAQPSLYPPAPDQGQYAHHAAAASSAAQRAGYM
ncbi:Sds3 domain-containing protein [Sporobolomyces koalae]|uniref:Sds3 domain-containing protein n=1 Tax=Sporobolomyces koalae TaxID=500713 RepID=UPI00317B575F